MNLILANNQLSQTPEMFLREIGYIYLEDRKTGNESFVRPLNRGYYPRFHLYLEQPAGKIILNLHLDQKQASYAGAHAHNAEYDGELVQEEIRRIKSLVTHDQKPTTLESIDILDKIRPEQFTPANKKEAKKNWWANLFS